MTAYVLIDLDVHDPEGFATYRTDVPALIAKHGGKYLVRGGKFEVLEGEWQPNRLVVLQFPDRQAIHNFFDDPDYSDLKALRQRVSDSVIIAVDGID